MDTTYLLPYSRMGVAADIFGEMEKNGVPIGDMGISSISLFELQAKAAKLGVPADYVVTAIENISDVFRVEQIHNIKIIEVATTLLKWLSDYIDCLILATAIVLEEGLITEDLEIRSRRNEIKDKYGIEVVNGKEFLVGLKI